MSTRGQGYVAYIVSLPGRIFLLGHRDDDDDKIGPHETL